MAAYRLWRMRIRYRSFSSTSASGHLIGAARFASSRLSFIIRSVLSGPSSLKHDQRRLTRQGPREVAQAGVVWLRVSGEVAVVI
jgi:hypothetical protein